MDVHMYSGRATRAEVLSSGAHLIKGCSSDVSDVHNALHSYHNSRHDASDDRKRTLHPYRKP